MEDDFDLSRFETLSEAFIDASSLIYMHKAHFLRQLQKSLRLYTVPEVLEEVGISAELFQIDTCPESHLPNDRKLLLCALKHQLPVISEDKKLLLQAKRVNLPYYNSLMMLNFLLYKQTINVQEFDSYHEHLQRHARYSQKVWQYGENVRQRIQIPLNPPLEKQGC